MGGREKVSIHCPPVASFFSSPQGHASQSQMSRMARERLSSVERRWAPSDGCGMGTRGEAHTFQLNLDPDSTMRIGCAFQEPEEALPKDSPAFPVAAAAFPVLGNGQLVPGHLRGKGHPIQLPKLPVRWKGPTRL